jgi:hydroxymethylpyrimidine/phosphomethylpyrimidine kinase
VQADLKTFSAFGVYGTTVLTALTAQSTRGVRAIADLAPDFVAAQMDVLLEDVTVDAAKTGMLSRAAVIDVVVDRLRARPVPHLVVDPVMVATSGARLLEPAAVDVLRRRLLPLATLVTPNLEEAEALVGRPVAGPADMRDAARALVDLGARAALVTGGHLAGEALDVLYDGGAFREFAAARVAGDVGMHGTGCALSAAITAALALGQALEPAVAAAKRYVTRGIAAAPRIGSGSRPVGHEPPSPTTKR